MDRANNNHRVSGLDLARALAIYGMVIVNFKTVLGASKNGHPILIWLTGLLEGRAAATFVVLAGVGVSLLSARGRKPGQTDLLVQYRSLLVRRATFLFLGGLAFCFIWPPDILHFYGVYILIGLCFLNASSRKLLGSACFFTLGFPLLLPFLDYGRGWNWETLEYKGLWTAAGMVRNLFFNGFHPIFPWCAFLLFGMWLGRQNLMKPGVARRILIGGIFVTIAIETLSFVLIKGFSLDESEARFLVSTDMMPPLPFYILAGVGAACMTIGACILIVEYCSGWRSVQWLISTGRLALTHYILHVVVGLGCLGIMGRLHNQSLAFACISASIFMAFAIFLSIWQLRYFSRGPFEWIMRALTGQTPESPRPCPVLIDQAKAGE